MKNRRNISPLRQKRDAFVKDRMMQNAANESLTPAQHNALMILTKYRHDMHTNACRFFADDTVETVKVRRFLSGPMETMLKSAGLPPLVVDNFLLMPDQSYADQLGLTGEFLETAKKTCESQIESLNSVIEDYLRNIDRTYGTWYCPTGSQRNRCRKQLETA